MKREITGLTTSLGLLALAVVLAGCGDKGGPAPGATASSSRPLPEGSKTAEEVAEEARGDVDCPADIDTPRRADGAPVDDVVGVRPGQTFDEAMNLVLCSGELLVANTDTGQRFNIKTYGATIRQGFSAKDAEPYVVKTSREYMQEMSAEFAARSGNAVRPDMQPGQSKWYVSTMGMPGAEHVIAAAREEWFNAGKNPTVDSVVAALEKKYGAPSRKQVAPHVVQLSWVYDPSTRFVPETSPLANQCVAMSDPDGGSNFSPDCGLVVAAQVWPLRDNPALAEHMDVGVADQAGGYQLITDTEKALESGEMAKRKQAVDDAAKNADGPKL